MMLGAIGTAHAQESTSPDPAAAEFHAQIELLLKAVPAEVHGARIAHADPIYQFYAQRSFHPAWTNPHTHIWLDVKDANGQVVNWMLEGYPPNVLERTGWKKDVTIKVGSGETSAVHRIPDPEAVVEMLNFFINERRQKK